MEPKPHHEYRGWRSTKLHLAILTQALIVFAYGMMGYPTMLFGEFCMSLLTAASIFTVPALTENLKRLKSPTADSTPPPAGP